MSVHRAEGSPLGVRMEAAAFSEIGPRTENQDAFTLEALAERGLVALADGMGGERNGRLAADTALGSLTGGDPVGSLDALRRAVRDADAAVREAAERDVARSEGMGCALGVLALLETGSGHGWAAAHVGDVRILSRSPDGALRLETRDHTAAFARWEAGEIGLDTVSEAEGSNRLTRAVGRGGEADLVWIPVRPGWSYLLVSDGVSKAMRLDELEEALSHGDPAAACEAIRQKVAERGADDNFTALVVRVAGGAAGRPAETERGMKSERGGGGIALAAAVAALLLAAAAAWFAWDARGRAVENRDLETRVERMQVEMEELRVELAEIRDPFGPTLPDQQPPGTEP
jgi:serine/threonine protein phosphatase PrpC